MRDTFVLEAPDKLSFPKIVVLLKLKLSSYFLPPGLDTTKKGHTINTLRTNSGCGRDAREMRLV